jgi:hypothetical protein
LLSNGTLFAKIHLKDSQGSIMQIYFSIWCCEQNVVWSFNCLFLCTAVWTWFSIHTCSSQFKWTKYNNAHDVSLHLLLVYWLVRHLHSYWVQNSILHVMGAISIWKEWNNLEMKCLCLVDVLLALA